ncbi:hypothetical protein SDC9_175262 [bioreactor metagenome]|uniref:Uncharacterized protein n=1 Tax=bioreactor metagenome TaxID=1076179 RepID=A0A645GLN1_9ZZZZ
MAAQLPPGKDVNAHGGQGAFGLCGLFLKLQYHVALAGVHDPETGGLGQRHLQYRHRARRACFFMVTQHVGVVHFINMVAAEDKDVFRVVLVDEVHVLVDGVGGAAVPFAALALHIGRQHEHAAVGQVQVPGLAGANVAVELQRLVLGQDTHHIDAGVGAVGERKIDNAIFPAKGHGGFCEGFCEQTQPRALSTCQKHGNAAFFKHSLHLL